MNDPIERQAAIDAVEFGIIFAKVINKRTGNVKELFQKENRSLAEAIERIKALPSAQPETHDKRTETHVCDLISRQAAIDAVIKRDANCGIDSAEVLKSPPSAQPELIEKEAYIRGFEQGRTQGMIDAQPERPRGEWIMTKEFDEYVATCPFCGAEMRRKSTGEKPEPPSFCSKCGADLRGGKDEQIKTMPV